MSHGVGQRQMPDVARQAEVEGVSGDVGRRLEPTGEGEGAGLASLRPWKQAVLDLRRQAQGAGALPPLVEVGGAGSRSARTPARVPAARSAPGPRRPGGRAPPVPGRRWLLHARSPVPAPATVRRHRTSNASPLGSPLALAGYGSSAPPVHRRTAGPLPIPRRPAARSARAAAAGGPVRGGQPDVCQAHQGPA